MDFFKGKRLGPYEVESFLGAGGMAQVYKAYEAAIDRHVAVKIVSLKEMSGPSFSERFAQEARLVAKLRHPHIVEIYGFGEVDGYAYMAMPLIEGGTLGDCMRDGPLGFDDVKRYLREIASALDYAHSKGVIHRDVKPGNVLMDRQGECLLTDFGVAKLMEGTAHLTGDRGDLFGTPVYMSPEQCEGLPLDHRTDIYSLGVILFQLLTGKVPYNADTPYAVMLKHIKEPVPPAREQNPSLPPHVDAVLARAMAKDREDRYSSASELAQDLAEDLDRVTSGAVAPPLSDWSGVVSRSPELSDLHMERTLRTPAKPIAWGWLVLALLAGLSAGAFFWADRSGKLDEWMAALRSPPAPMVLPVPGPVEDEVEAPGAPASDLESELQSLVARADAQFGRKQYTVPADDNSVSNYRAVLELAPGDAHATQRLAAISAFFQRRSKALEEQGSLREAAGYARKALLATPDDAALAVRTASLTEAAARAPQPSGRPAAGVAGMINVPAGEFQMGSVIGRPDARVQHAVSLGAYAIDRTEVTVADYRACVEAGVCMEPGVTDACNWPRTDFETHPVNCVSWNQARAYCDWAGKRLPTEAEWERAARGTDGRLYPWGDARIDLRGRVANVADSSARGRLRGQVPGYDDGFPETAPVGSFPGGASPVGAEDMTGNVWEWVADWYGPDYYATSPTRNPAGPASGTYRVLRGGSWAVDVTDWFQSAYRYRRSPTAQVFDVGFRCAR